MTFNYPTLKFQDILKSLCRNAEKGKLELLCMKVENTFHANYGHAWYPCGSMCPHAREKRTNKRELHSTTHFLDSKAKFGRLKTPSKGYVWKLALTCEPEMITLFQSKTAELLKQSLLNRPFSLQSWVIRSNLLFRTAPTPTSTLRLNHYQTSTFNKFL